MSFGKRTRKTSNQPPEPPTTEHGSDPGYNQPENPSTVRFLTGLFLGLTIASLLYITYVQCMRQTGNKLDHKFEAQMSDATNPTPQLALLKTAEADGWDLGNCRVFKPPSAIDDVWPSRFANRDERDWGMLSNVGGDISIALANKASFIECVINRETKRLCATDIRAAFAKDAAELYGELAQFSSHLPPGSSPHDAEFERLLETIESAHPDIGISDARKRVQYEISGAMETLGSSLQSAIAAGYISAADFGWFAPRPVYDILASTPVLSSSCP